MSFDAGIEFRFPCRRRPKPITLPPSTSLLKATPSAPSTNTERAIDADPNFTEAMHGMTRALEDLERFDEAIAVAKRIAELDPDDVLAHTSLSVLYRKKGMIPEAEADGNKARVLGWKQQLKNPSSWTT